jgi:hypothetical protein
VTPGGQPQQSWPQAVSLDRKPDTMQIDHAAGQQPSATEAERKAKIERMTTFFSNKLSRTVSYHDSKEKMAHAALVLTFALVGVVGPVKSNIEVAREHPVAMFWVVMGLWLLIHWFVRLQLRRKRLAAAYNTSMEMVLLKWALNPPTDAVLDGREPPEHIGRFRRSVLLVLDFFFVSKRSKPGKDWLEDDYPAVVIQSVNRQLASTGSIRDERIVTLANIAFGVILAILIWPFC